MSGSKSSKLRSGYTTGACAAAASKAAALILLRDMNKASSPYKAESDDNNLPHPLRGGDEGEGVIKEKTLSVDIPFPDGSRVSFRIHDSGRSEDGCSAWASVVKDGGDDPDVTNGAEIRADVRIIHTPDHEKLCTHIHDRRDNNIPPPLRGGDEGEGENRRVIIRGGSGVGIVTKPGLPVPAGEPAINPVPRKMIMDAVMEALSPLDQKDRPACEVTISVPDGEAIAKKTLNHRLGIVGGISILGTTGIVRPLSAEAWTATISSGMDVARAMGRDIIVLSSGRTSERPHVESFGLPEECYVMMGDYAEYSLREASTHGFRKVHLCAMWGKMLKIAMATPQTHVRHGAIDMKKTVEFLNRLGISVPSDIAFNTAREIFFYISERGFLDEALSKVCEEARKYAETITCGIPVECHLVSYEGRIVFRCSGS